VKNPRALLRNYRYRFFKRHTPKGVHFPVTVHALRRGFAGL
jgi:hypothetical protein